MHPCGKIITSQYVNKCLVQILIHAGKYEFAKKTKLIIHLYWIINRGILIMGKIKVVLVDVMKKYSADLENLGLCCTASYLREKKIDVDIIIN